MTKKILALGLLISLFTACKIEEKFDCNCILNPQSGIEMDSLLLLEDSLSNSIGERVFVEVEDDGLTYLTLADDAGNEVWSKNYDTTGLHTFSTPFWSSDNELWVLFKATQALAKDSINTGYLPQHSNVNATAFSNAPFPSYGTEGIGVTIAVIAHIDKATGQLDKGTYLYAKTSEDETAPISIHTIGASGDGLALQIESGYTLPQAGATADNYLAHPDQNTTNSTNNNWKMLVEFDVNLTQLKRADLVFYGY